MFAGLVGGSVGVEVSGNVVKREVGRVVTGITISGGTEVSLHRGWFGCNGGSGLSRCRGAMLMGMVGGSMGVEFPEYVVKRSVGRAIGAVTPHSVVTIVVGTEEAMLQG